MLVIYKSESGFVNKCYLSCPLRKKSGYPTEFEGR